MRETDKDRQNKKKRHRARDNGIQSCLKSKSVEVLSLKAKLALISSFSLLEQREREKEGKNTQHFNFFFLLFSHFNPSVGIC